LPQRPLFASILVVFALSCGTLPGGGPVLSEVKATPPVITPNGDSADHAAEISYTLSRDATVSIWFRDDGGRTYPFRQDEQRPAGSYAASFDGTYVPADDPRARRTFPDGRYRFTVRAVTDDGKEYSHDGEVIVRDADAIALTISDLIATPPTISPDGDGKDDEMVLGWDLSKPAEVTVFATDAQDRRYLIQAPVKRDAGPDSFSWNGKADDQLLTDGTYQMHVRAVDATGNVTEATLPATISGGGKAKLEITKVVFSPTAIPVGGTIDVRITVKNTGTVPIWSSCPKSGATYNTNESYTKFAVLEGDFQRPECFDRNGVWRVGVDWDQSPKTYPARWAITDDPNIPLRPEEERTITGHIQVLITQVRQIFFWAGVEQGGVGFSGRRGITRITVSY
jgi:hypothetical protein